MRRHCGVGVKRRKCQVGIQATEGVAISRCPAGRVDRRLILLTNGVVSTAVTYNGYGVVISRIVIVNNTRAVGIDGYGLSRGRGKACIGVYARRYGSIGGSGEILRCVKRVVIVLDILLIMVNLIRRVGVCSPLCSQSNIVSRFPRAATILCFSVIPTCKGVTCTGRRRQGIRRIVGYGLGAFAHRTAISVKRYGVVVSFPICGVGSISVTTRRNNHSHSSLIKPCSGPANEGIACTGRLNEGDVTAFNVVSRRIGRAVRSALHRITDAIGNRNGSRRYHVTVRVL